MGMTASSTLAAYCSRTLRKRALDQGGFAMFPGGSFRADATAWAVFSLAAAGTGGGDLDIIESGRSRLADNQSEDGRVGIAPYSPGSFWPTPLAVLAWLGSKKHAEQRSRAVEFLLGTSGRHWVGKTDSPAAQDDSIPGWSWTQETYAWVEPTSLAIIALQASGLGEHARVREGIRLLMNRQLPSGGWNYGNTIVFGSELYPQAYCTGMALTALAGRAPESEVKDSLRYLETRTVGLRTPLSLGWGLLGLGAWARWPKQAMTWLGECIARQETFGPYDTPLISLLLLALEGKHVLARLFP